MTLSITRISKPFGKVILGVDTHGLLDESAIYQITKFGDELMLSKIGSTSINEPKPVGSLHGYSIQELALDGRYLFTDEELGKTNKGLK